MVMEKLRATIEKGRLIFVAFDDELFPAAQPIAAIVEIRNHAANQKIRSPRGHLENPGEHRGSCGLAMGAGHHNRSATPDEIVLQKLRHRAIRNFLVENEFE